MPQKRSPATSAASPSRTTALGWSATARWVLRESWLPRTKMYGHLQVADLPQQLALRLGAPVDDVAGVGDGVDVELLGQLVHQIGPGD